ncbi:prolyl oligopeptidase family serine peptidase [Mangrovibacterium sp.]|uniref:prolyl oligopeptidase family serine peptidase n=1 Tax=Mangrovibacterium sp. TaxID=1961364 RepID=UPI0035664CAC
MSKHSLFILLAIFIFSASLRAQQTVSFPEGMVVGSVSQGARSAVFTDPVFYRFNINTNYTPAEDDSVGMGRRGNVERWAKIESTEGVFKSPKLNGGYLFVTYNSEKSGIQILEVSGHSEIYVNGIPRGGDVYNKHLMFLPIELKKGENTFWVKGSRGEVKMQLLELEKPIAFMQRDMTIPDFLTTENNLKVGAIRILNSTQQTQGKLRIVAEANGVKTETAVSSIVPLTMRKVAYSVMDSFTMKDTVRVHLKLYLGNKLIDETSIPYFVRTPEERYSRTFISGIDGSVQYFSVREGNIAPDTKPAMFLSLHGASVEARRQAAEYKAKDWGHVICPTNRRDYGFDWEDWGRLDALEVQQIAEEMYGTDPARTFLTGHSMGGHGTWQLGVLYPGKWAAISPLSGWYSLFSYANKEQLTDPSPLENRFVRASNSSNTLEMSRNYLQHGIYIQHGDSDNVVPVEQARFMREHLGQFHPDFAYLEYPEKKHWFGVDFSSIFNYFNEHSIPENGDVKTFEFRSPSPGVSAESRFVTLWQQEKPYEFCGVNVTQTIPNETQKKKGEILKNRLITVESENLKLFKLDLKHCAGADTLQVEVDDDSFENLAAFAGNEVWFAKENESWSLTDKPESTFGKNPLRYGNFKDAFRHNMVFVYSTAGTKEENDWSLNKARFDAETFYYRGNGSIDLVADKDFTPEKFKDRSVILFGNASTNAAWKSLLADCPVQIKRGELNVGDKTLAGTGYGAYFIYPRKDSKIASVGVISGSGIDGFRAVTPNRYFRSGASIPDLMVFTSDMYVEGINAVKAAGYFGNDWSIGAGDIVWNE